MTKLKNGVETVYAKTRDAWRKWLQKNHRSSGGVWLIIFKKETGIPSVYYAEAVEEALCFGWIDSKANKKDESSYYQSFYRRNPKSKWSKINKLRVKKLIKEKRLTQAGLDAIQTAKKNGTWTALDEIENITIPKDLAVALEKNKLAKKNFPDFPRSSKKGILEWIMNAKKKETREKRINETVTLAARNIRANHYSNNH